MPQMRPMGEVKCLVIHHSAGPSGSVEVFRQEHKAKGWADIGYHAVIGNGHGQGDGICEPGRPEHFEGSGVFGNNAGKLHVCLVGNFENTAPTRAQLNTLGDWLKHRIARYGRGLTILGHCEAAIEGHATLCPGAWMRPRLDAIRHWVHAQIAGSEVRPLADFLLQQPHVAGLVQGAIPAPAKPTFAQAVAAAAPVEPTHEPVTVHVQVKGYANDEAKKVVEAEGLMIGDEAFVKLADLITGLVWDEPVHDISGDVRKITVGTKRNVRQAQSAQAIQDLKDRQMDAALAGKQLLK